MNKIQTMECSVSNIWTIQMKTTRKCMLNIRNIFLRSFEIWKSSFVQVKDKVSRIINTFQKLWVVRIQTLSFDGLELRFHENPISLSHIFVTSPFILCVNSLTWQNSLYSSKWNCVFNLNSKMESLLYTYILINCNLSFFLLQNRFWIVQLGLICTNKSKITFQTFQYETSLLKLNKFVLKTLCNV